MCRYIVHVVRKDGGEGYLCRGSVVRMGAATKYSSPSGAWSAFLAFTGKHHGSFIGSVVDLRDHRRSVPKSERVSA